MRSKYICQLFTPVQILRAIAISSITYGSCKYLKILNSITFCPSLRLELHKILSTAAVPAKLSSFVFARIQLFSLQLFVLRVLLNSLDSTSLKMTKINGDLIKAATSYISPCSTYKNSFFAIFMAASLAVHFQLSFHHILVQNKNKTSILTANYRLGARIKNREQTWCRQSTLLRAKLNQQQIAQWTATWAPAGSQERCGSACDRFRLIYAAPHARCPFVNHILGGYRALFQSPALQVHASGGI